MNAYTDKDAIDSRIRPLSFIKIKPQTLSIGIMPVPDREVILMDVIPQ